MSLQLHGFGEQNKFPTKTRKSKKGNIIGV